MKIRFGKFDYLNFYNETYLKRFKGILVDYSGIENSETFADAKTASEEMWQAEIEKFDSATTNSFTAGSANQQNGQT